MLLAIPAVIAKGIIFKLHTVQGFDFNSAHLQTQLNKLIYTKNLKALCDNIVHQCPVCILSKPKRLRKICGSQRSQVYRPGECIIVDSLFLPKDRFNHSKSILIVDAASSKVSIFPVTNLKDSFQTLPLLYCTTTNLQSGSQE